MDTDNKSKTLVMGAAAAAAAATATAIATDEKTSEPENASKAPKLPASSTAVGPKPGIAAATPKSSLLAVGTANKCKLAAVKSVCSKMGKLLLDYDVSSHKVKSNVKEQPDSLEETIKGAQHRARSAFVEASKDSTISGKIIGIGIESGLFFTPNDGRMFDTTVCSSTEDGVAFQQGLSCSFEIPPVVAKFVEGGMDLAQAANAAGLTTNPALGEAEGIIGILSHGAITRQDYTESAIITSLFRLANPTLFVYPPPPFLFASEAFKSLQPSEDGDDDAASDGPPTTVIFRVGAGRRYKVDVKAMKQINLGTGYARSIKRVKPGVWAWPDYDGLHQYGAKECKTLEKLYQDAGCPSAEPVMTGQTITKMLKETVPNVEKMRGQRDAVPVITMIGRIYQTGLFTMGQPTAPVNKEVIAALRAVFKLVSPMKAKDLKRVNALTTIANSCLDCQQVQAREILRIYGDLTNKTQTLEMQLRFFLTRQKEHALNAFISEHHDDCDKDHTQVNPGQQRAHLYSAYLKMLGPKFGMLGYQAAIADRFLSAAVAQIIDKFINPKTVRKSIVEQLSVKEFCQEVLSDINNQQKSAERLIDRKCVWKWAGQNFPPEEAMEVTYDEDRAADFEGQTPNKPTEENKYDVFLSKKMLMKILVKMKFVEQK